jgi:hypothetical protein
MMPILLYKIFSYQSRIEKYLQPGLNKKITMRISRIKEREIDVKVG